MIERNTRLTRIEAGDDGVFIKIAVELVEDGTVLSSRTRRECVTRGAPASEVMSVINAALAVDGENELSESDVNKVLAVVEALS